MERFDFNWQATALRLGESNLNLGQVVLLAALTCVILLVLLLMMSGLKVRKARRREQQLLDRGREQQARMSELVNGQSELAGRLSAMAQNVTEQQASMTSQLNQRLDGMSGRIGQSISENSKSTQENLSKLRERLAVIDSAQNNIKALANEVVELKGILANKQTRGAFGQSRMETIVRDGLAMGAFEFQATLSNGKRPDCLIKMPNDTPSLVIDAKFPLESWTQIRDAETEEFRKSASTQFRKDMEVHIKAISEKYLIPAETQDTAFLFVPSESIFAEIHENFSAVVQKAHRARVVIVSPSLLMLSIQVVQSVLKDARMREQAHLIQAEVAHLINDVARLDDRVRKLSGHFGLVQKDLDMIETSTGKVLRRGNRISELEFEAAPTSEQSDSVEETPKLRAVSNRD